MLKVRLHFQEYEISRVLPTSFAPSTGLFYARIVRFWHRVATGAYAPAAPTDPDVRDYRIRLLD